jgi:hypothetical protein
MAATATKTALLTQLGQALGCTQLGTAPADAKMDGFPARCWYAGPLEPPTPRRPHVSLERPSLLEQERRNLIRLGNEQLDRFIAATMRARRRS